MALVHASSAQVVALQPPDPQLPARTSALVKTEQFEAIHLMVAEGATIPAHHVDGPLTLYCIEGCVELVVEGATLQLETGDWTFLEGGVQHAVRGIHNARLVLTVIFPGARLPGTRSDPAK